MLRGARLDAPETLHHVMVRGIEIRNIVDDDDDRENFVTRIGELGLDTGTSIFAWALIDDHAHILLKSGAAGLPAFMRRLLGGMRHIQPGGTRVTGIYFKTGTSQLSARKIPISGNSCAIFILIP